MWWICLLPALLALSRHWCVSLWCQRTLMPGQKSFIRRRKSQLTLRDWFCFTAHNSGSAVPHLHELLLRSCLAQGQHHLPPLWCQMLLLFPSSRISGTAQQPSAELSPPPPKFQLFCHLSSSYSSSELQFPGGCSSPAIWLELWPSFSPFCGVILISWAPPVSRDLTVSGQGSFESCSLFPSKLMNKL